VTRAGRARIARGSRAPSSTVMSQIDIVVEFT
jgi:hypothetical protein